MLRHKYFKELCALAAGDQLPLSRMQELEAHLVGCPKCMELAGEYRQLHRVVIDPINQKAEAVIESSRERVKAAMWAGIARVDQERSAATQETEAVVASSRDRVSTGIWSKIALVDKEGSPATIWGANLRLLRAPSERPYLMPRWVGPAALAAAAVISFWLGTELHRGKKPTVTTTQYAQRSPAGSIAQPTSAPVVDPAKAELQDQVVKLAQALKEEQQHSDELQLKLGNDDRDLSQAIAAENALREEIDQQAATVKATQAELDARKTVLEQAQSTTSSDSSTIASLELQVRDLNSRLNTENASLDRERDLLSHGREIRDIIGARNLHIIDVYDTNTGGATAKPFARAFYTEGKSLVYYAYDLPQRRADEGSFSYVAWGESNGNKTSIKKIGILFHDDQTQRRWSLNFSAPQVLREIDSVFITLERNDEDLSQPKGKRMLTAYLGTAPNHP